MASETDHTTVSEGESRALVPTGSGAYRRLSQPPCQAAFLAQLIATRDQLPQTRERRRVAPAQAVNAYRTAATLAT
jgi:hypothetical protein